MEQSVEGDLWEGDHPVVACAVIAQPNHAISRPMLFDSFQGHVFDRALHGLIFPQHSFLSKSRNLTQCTYRRTRVTHF